MFLILRNVVQGVAEGPRASDRFTCVTAALVSGVSARGDSIEFGANFVASLAHQLELGLSSSDTLAQSNLGNLLAHLYMTELLTANCLFSFLERLRKSFQEQDVAMIHLILKACGLKLRSDDSVAMKVIWDFSEAFCPIFHTTQPSKLQSHSPELYC